MLDYKRKYLDVIRHYFELAKASDNEAARVRFFPSFSPAIGADFAFVSVLSLSSLTRL